MSQGTKLHCAHIPYIRCPFTQPTRFTSQKLTVEVTVGTASSRYRAALWLPVRGVSGLTRNACNALTVFQVRQVKTLELNESQATRPALVQLQSEPGGHHGACFWKHCPGNAASVTPGSGRHMTHGRECVCYKPQGSEGISHSRSHNRGWRQGQEAFSTFALHIPFSVIQLCGLLFTTDLSLLDIWQLAMCSAPWHVCKKGPKNRAKQLRAEASEIKATPHWDCPLRCCHVEECSRGNRQGVMVQL